MDIIFTGDNDVKERLSIAYLTAVAAHAGCELMEVKTQRDGVDVLIKPITGATHLMIRVQAKATSRLSRINGGALFSFQLDRYVYDLLRRPSVMPALLVVYDMPEDPEEWVVVTAEKTALRRAGFWKDLRGAPEVEADSAAVRISPSNIFDKSAIVDVLTRAESASW
ncbi:MAG TPA: DUF4365 domain-containing protein [Azospirillaceae bacterium]|nr:DUF4365 domain-containing protein [Azospirillaceae bacterium]HRQ80891.1 DUF4365 domain-containing protein [Azospirillaceae bacterium]